MANPVDVHSLAAFPAAAFSVSDAGHVIYRGGASAPRRQFVWFDRAGQERGRVGNPDDGIPFFSPAMSPDGRRLALHRGVDGNVDLWLLELSRGSLVRFTSDPANEIHAFWSPDGTRIVYSSNRSGEYELYEKAIAGVQEEKRLLRQCAVTDWSWDGRLILCQRRDATTSGDVFVLRDGAGEEPTPVVQTSGDDRDAQFSPDGRWIAYASTESGRWEIYVQPFPGPGSPSPVSLNGGAQPRWRRDGRELFFIALDERLMAAPMSLSTDGGSLEAGRPVVLFPTRIGGAVPTASRTQYFAAPDGSRFLMNTIIDAPVASPITLILNWKAP